MVVQTRLFSCGVSISHVEQRRGAFPSTRYARSRQRGTGEPGVPIQSTFTLAWTNLQVWRRRLSPEARCHSRLRGRVRVSWRPVRDDATPRLGPILIIRMRRAAPGPQHARLNHLASSIIAMIAKRIDLSAAPPRLKSAVTPFYLSERPHADPHSSNSSASTTSPVPCHLCRGVRRVLGCRKLLQASTQGKLCGLQRRPATPYHSTIGH
jgi:hypothetical protein